MSRLGLTSTQKRALREINLYWRGSSWDLIKEIAPELADFLEGFAEPMLASRPPPPRRYLTLREYLGAIMAPADQEETQPKTKRPSWWRRLVDWVRVRLPPPGWRRVITQRDVEALQKKRGLNTVG